MTEEWRKIPSYPDYEVSNMGNVRRCGRLLKPTLYTNGYYCVQLSSDSIRKSKTIHRLVASLFIPNPDNKEFIDHLSGNKLDNRVENLKWATPSENKLNPNTPQKIGVSGLRHIYKRSDTRYYVSIQRNSQVVFCETFPTQEEAILARDNFLTLRPNSPK
jgi:hypothetical protein